MHKCNYSLYVSGFKMAIQKRKCYKILQVSHYIHQTIGKNPTKPLNCVECGCMRKRKVVDVHAMEAYGAAEV